MRPEPKIVISASRRTDIPAFYMPWFMSRLDKGFFEVTNPYNHKISVVPASADKVHTLVFWSKNFGPFINGGYAKILLKKGYHLFFNFTINSANTLLEPNVPSLRDRLNQLEDLCGQLDPKHINWRFDPLCFYQNFTGVRKSNLNDFSQISDRAAEAGIQRCITSFMDHYPKIQKRIARMKGFSFIDPPLEKKRKIILQMEKVLSPKKISLYTCCEKDLLASLPECSGITGSSCISGTLLTDLFGGRVSLRKDTGQRVKAGCGCRVSSDIGSYNRHPCFNNCLFCYANPTSAPIQGASTRHPAQKAANR